MEKLNVEETELFLSALEYEYNHGMSEEDCEKARDFLMSICSESRKCEICRNAFEK